MISRITPILLSLLSFSVVFASSPLRFPGEKSSHIGIVVRDLSTGKDIVNYNAIKSLAPASVMKSVTTATALSLLGPDYRYQTDVYLRGDVEDGCLNGDIVIKGAGDPSVYSKEFPENHHLISDIVLRLKEKGINKIAGWIVVDDSKYEDQGQILTWELEDLGYSYGAGLYSFNYSDNVFELNTNNLSTSPFIPEIEAIVRQSDKLNDRYHGLNSPLYIIYGKDVLKPGNKVVLPMYNPSLSFIHDLRSALETDGIRFVDTEEESTNDSIPLLTNLSPRLEEIMKSLMVRSDNMMAEATLRTIAPDSLLPGAIDVELDFLKNKGIAVDDVVIRDGSGLARGNTLQPKMLADMLEMMSKSENADKYISFFPRAGKEGTMRNFLPKSRFTGRLALKTGSMSGVLCYAGYLLDYKNRPTHAVVVMVNNFNCSKSSVKNAVENFIRQTLK